MACGIALRVSFGASSRQLGALALATLVAGAACTRTPRDRSDVIVRDSSGVRIAESLRPSWDGSRGWCISGTPSVDIGVLEGRTGEQLFRVRQALQLDDGQFVIANAGTSEIRFFGPDGTFLHSVGGEGGGPGEFRELTDLSLDGEDSLLAFDGVMGRVQVLDIRGTFISSFRLDPTGDPYRGLGLYRLAGRFAEGGLLLVGEGSPADMRRQEPTLYWDSLPNLSYSMEGTLLDTISFGGMQMLATRRSAGPPMLGRRSSAYLHRDRFYIGLAEHYEIQVYGPEGEIRQIIRRAWKPRAVVRPEIDGWVQNRLTEITDQAERRRAREAVDQYLRESALPEVMPAYSDLIVDANGNLWVRDYQPPWELGSAPWSVFGPEGEWLGIIHLPYRFRPTDIGSDYVLGVWQDELDVEHLRLYALRRECNV